MSEEKWLDGYSGQTTDELIRLQGEYRTDSIVLAFEQALDEKAGRIGQDGLTAEENVILAVEALEREVNNGGYGQFFINSSKEYAPFVVDALKRIGCADAAHLTQQAIDALGIEGQVTVEAIDSVMKSRLTNETTSWESVTNDTTESQETSRVPYLSSSSSTQIGSW